MAAWWPRLVAAQFRPALGADVFDTVRNKLLPTGAADPAAGPSAPDFADGWYGYGRKDPPGPAHPAAGHPQVPHRPPPGANRSARADAPGARVPEAQAHDAGEGEALDRARGG